MKESKMDSHSITPKIRPPMVEPVAAGPTPSIVETLASRLSVIRARIDHNNDRLGDLWGRLSGEGFPETAQSAGHAPKAVGMIGAIDDLLSEIEHQLSRLDERSSALTRLG
jgi:hypothetical protein